MSNTPKRDPCGDDRVDDMRHALELDRQDAAEKELGRRRGWNSAIRRAAEIAEHYAKLMKSEAAQRVADEIRAMKSDP